LSARGAWLRVHNRVEHSAEWEEKIVLYEIDLKPAGREQPQVKQTMPSFLLILHIGMPVAAPPVRPSILFEGSMQTPSVATKVDEKVHGPPFAFDADILTVGSHAMRVPIRGHAEGSGLAVTKMPN
jgi:hypothetical protein